jgi:hypothetical protein
MSRILPFATILCFTSAALAEPSAKVVEGKVVVTGLKNSRGLQLVVAEGTEKTIVDRPQVGGEWSYADSKATFTPKYPFEPGTKYRVYRGDWKHEFTIPREKSKPTNVTRVLPESSVIPENILRFYIEFNQAMPRGDVYRYVTIHTEAGKQIEQPFVELDNELWNIEQTRITLLIDPGRIKKEVKPRIDLGPVFERGKKYTLVISGKWPTLDGGTLGSDIRKPLTVTAPQSNAIDPKMWKLSPPASESGELMVTFDRPMDHHVMVHALTVIGPAGKEIAGQADSSGKDRVWTFRSKTPWQPGDYNLRVETFLEDVCGNRIGKPFEVDLTGPPPKEVKAERIDIPFTIASR